MNGYYDIEVLSINLIRVLIAIYLIKKVLGVIISGKNVSPIGWYVGSYIIRFVELNTDKNEDPERKFTAWENTILVQADNLEDAYDKVVEQA
ncbi:DUF4288 domain-containing protein [Gynuella sunshinyii]|uniref:Uncharacterized protein n=1 Tax=Gynuella sunshinyii YC6258 TaxID=1445510 RepID=A0A0C5VMH7_9GAMM|nr:DUF4288 domain-containing protein [Gynuella sunshinyii]AJQ95521.1 hypothetical Protein YC6258_03485 [Gynuella sunshinyii YC6258]